MIKFSGCSHTTSGLIAATPKRRPASLSMTNPSKTKIEIHSVCSTHTREKQYEYHSLQFQTNSHTGRYSPLGVCWGFCLKSAVDCWDYRSLADHSKRTQPKQGNGSSKMLILTLVLYKSLQAHYSVSNSYADGYTFKWRHPHHTLQHTPNTTYQHPPPKVLWSGYTSSKRHPNISPQNVRAKKVLESTLLTHLY